MTPEVIFRTYVSERQLVAPPGYRLDRIDRLTRLTPLAADLEGVIMFSELSPMAIEGAITDQIDYFQSLGRSFEWKVYSLDQPTDLPRRLLERGFVAGDSEAFMVCRVDAGSEAKLAQSFRIERITSELGIDHVIEVQEAVWRRSFPWLKRALLASLEKTAMFCAYHKEVPIGTGWIDFPAHSSFAELHGGAVLPQQRSRGVYSALFQARVCEARARGFRFVAVDAAPMSRPILLRRGFDYICDTIPFRKMPNQ